MYCEHEQKPYLGDQQLVSSVQQYLSQKTILIQAGADQNTYMQASVPKYRTSVGVEIARMKLFVIVKLIHGLGHLLTYVFMPMLVLM